MIFLNTKLASKTFRLQPQARVMDWLTRYDAELALSTVVIAELAFGIEKIHPEQRARRLGSGLDAWRQRFSGRIFAFTEEAALVYGHVMGQAVRNGRPLSAQDGMIAAIALANASPLATRNQSDFEPTSVELINPWKE